MGQLLHRSAPTTAAVRQAIHQSQASLKVLAEQYDINPKTVTIWMQRSFVHDAPMDPKQSRSIALLPAQEVVCVVFRTHTLLSLDE